MAAESCFTVIVVGVAGFAACGAFAAGFAAADFTAPGFATAFAVGLAAGAGLALVSATFFAIA